MILSILFLAAVLFAVRIYGHHAKSIPQLPAVVLWDWERPEDLRFIDTHDTAVAFLAETIQLRGGEVVVRPRFQPLRVPEETRLMAVVRIETDRAAPSGAALSEEQAMQSAASISRTSSLPRVVAVQVDFDATLSQRAFYRGLLVELRKRLGPKTPISITALASWCMEDDWMAGLPIEEAVPMLFRMGAGANDVVSRISAGRDFREPLCRGSLGISTDERWALLPGGRRLYVFSPQAWTQHGELAVLWETHAWR